MKELSVPLFVICSLIAGAGNPPAIARDQATPAQKTMPSPSSPLVDEPTAGAPSVDKSTPKGVKKLTFEIEFQTAGKDPGATWREIADKVAAANQKFAPVGVSFAYTDNAAALPDTFIVLETIRERHKLKKYFKKRAINVFVLDRILDPTPSKATKRAARWQWHRPSGLLAGAHIPYKKAFPDTYIILKATSHPLTLAHELGHMFGLPHSKDPLNIMSYGSERHSFNPRQLKVIRKNTKRLHKQLKRRNKTGRKTKGKG